MALTPSVARWPWLARVVLLITADLRVLEPPPRELPRGGEPPGFRSRDETTQL